MPVEPCTVCGEDTSLGRPEFIGRREAKAADGSPRWLCAECDARSRPSRRHELSDEERRRLEQHGMMFGIAFNATGH
jgi:hypothetical protein